MKTIKVLTLILLIVLYGMPLSVPAQGPAEVFALPDATAGEAYRANIEAVLRDKYRLKLETDARASVFRWALVGGQTPPGLVIRANGTVMGSPRIPRAEPYQFQVKVLDLSLPHGEALILDFSIFVLTPRIRLAHISIPRLVLTNGPDVLRRQSDDSQGDSQQS